MGLRPRACIARKRKDVQATFDHEQERRMVNKFTIQRFYFEFARAVGMGRFKPDPAPAGRAPPDHFFESDTDQPLREVADALGLTQSGGELLDR